jgi:hypothetical protein
MLLASPRDGLLERLYGFFMPISEVLVELVFRVVGR